MAESDRAHLGGKSSVVQSSAQIGDLDRFFDLALDMLCISSGDGFFKRLNPAFHETLGWTLEEMLTTPYLDYVHPDDIESTKAEVVRQMEAGERVLHFENRYRHRDGSYRILAWRSIPQPGGLMYAVARDVTEVRRQERELLEKNLDLEQFTRAVAHDLRSPLRAIGSYAQILIDDVGQELPVQARADLARIVANADKMAKTFDGLLRFSRAGIQELDKRTVQVQNLVEEIVRDQRQSETGNRVDFRVGPMSPANADPQLLHIVLSNLISNAVKYSRLRDAPVVETGQSESEGKKAFFVRDNGAGFDMRDAGRLFRTFERVHPISIYEGYGIGLATVQRIVQRHGGDVWAEGRIDEGATFYFTLP